MAQWTLTIELFAAVFLLIYVARLVLNSGTGGVYLSGAELLGYATVKRSLLNQHIRRRA